MRNIDDKMRLFNMCIDKISKNVYDQELRLDELISASNAMIELQKAIDRLKRLSRNEFARDSEEALDQIIKIAFDQNQ